MKLIEMYWGKGLEMGIGTSIQPWVITKEEGTDYAGAAVVHTALVIQLDVLLNPYLIQYLSLFENIYYFIHSIHPSYPDLKLFQIANREILWIYL